MSNLAGKELYKYEWRAELFLKKFRDGEEFELTNGKRVAFHMNKAVVDVVTNRRSTTGVALLGKDGTEYHFKDLKKNVEFGGRGEGSGTAKEDKELESLIKLIDAAKATEASTTIRVQIGTKTYNVFTAVTTPGTPKSDFHLIDETGKEVVWISHKDGKTAKDFQQWGGISQSKEPTVFNHIETQKFIADLKKEYKDGLPRATTLFRKIEDRKLKMLSVYGNAYGGPLGKQNVSILLQGPVGLIKRGNVYFLTANHIHYNGDSVDADGFEPVLMAIYKGDRSDAGVKGTRIVISPIMGRKGVPF